MLISPPPIKCSAKLLPQTCQKHTQRHRATSQSNLLFWKQFRKKASTLAEKASSETASDDGVESTDKAMIKLWKCVFECGTKLALKSKHKRPPRTPQCPPFKKIASIAPQCSLNGTAPVEKRYTKLRQWTWQTLYLLMINMLAVSLWACWCQRSAQSTVLKYNLKEPLVTIDS